MERLNRLTIIILVAVLMGCLFCGALTARAKPALSPVVGAICSVSWQVEYHPTGVTLRLNIDCPGLTHLRPIHRLRLGPIERK